MNADIREVNGKGWIATVDHEGYVIYAIGNNREECVARFKRAIVFYNDEYIRNTYGTKSHLPAGYKPSPGAWDLELVNE